MAPAAAALRASLLRNAGAVGMLFPSKAWELDTRPNSVFNNRPTLGEHILHLASVEMHLPASSAERDLRAATPTPICLPLIASGPRSAYLALSDDRGRVAGEADLRAAPRSSAAGAYGDLTHPGGNVMASPGGSGPADPTEGTPALNFDGMVVLSKVSGSGFKISLSAVRGGADAGTCLHLNSEGKGWEAEVGVGSGTDEGAGGSFHIRLAAVSGHPHDTSHFLALLRKIQGQMYWICVEKENLRKMKIDCDTAETANSCKSKQIEEMQLSLNKIHQEVLRFESAAESAVFKAAEAALKIKIDCDTAETANSCKSKQIEKLQLSLNKIHQEVLRFESAAESAIFKAAEAALAKAAQERALLEDGFIQLPPESFLRTWKMHVWRAYQNVRVKALKATRGKTKLQMALLIPKGLDVVYRNGKDYYPFFLNILGIYYLGLSLSELREYMQMKHEKNASDCANELSRFRNEKEEKRLEAEREEKKRLAAEDDARRRAEEGWYDWMMNWFRGSGGGSGSV